MKLLEQKVNYCTIYFNFTSFRSFFSVIVYNVNMVTKSVPSCFFPVVKHATLYLYIPQEGVGRCSAWWLKMSCHCIACILVPGSCWPADYLYSSRRGPSQPAGEIHVLGHWLYIFWLHKHLKHIACSKLGETDTLWLHWTLWRIDYYNLDKKKTH